ncbi:MAG TPA: serine/threonine-protein kinase [Candidatus Angelobacter sp.]
MEDATGAATTTLSPEAGPRTDRLELVQQLAGGTVGVVHKAKNPKFNRLVALRQVQVPEWLDDVDDLLKRILAEARAASALDHPSIARLYTGGYKKFTVFLTSEFIDGVSVKDFARSLSVPEVIALSKQLCSALDCAHQKKVVHYALNPANIKVLPDGTLKVLDFGLLREKQLYAPTPAKRLESEHYLSPEQVKNKPVTAASNLFTAATIIYELLTTRNPFAGKHLGEVDRNITDIDPAPASMAHNRVPEAVSKVVMRALAKNPMARFQSCAELGTALEEALNASGAKTPATAVPTSTGKMPSPVAAGSNGKSNAQNQPAKAASTPPVKPAPAPVIAPALTNEVHPSAAISTNGANGNGHAPKPVAPPKPAPPAVRTQTALPAPSKMPVKMLAQWKLVGGIVAGLFVVSAVAISLNHRGKLPSSAPVISRPVVEQPSKPPDSSLPVPPAAPAIDMREVQSRVSRGRTVKAEPASAPALVVDGELVISSEPAGASFTVEGRSTESWKTPQTVGSLAPAVYRVTVSKSGYSTETRSVQVTSGNRVALDVRLTPLKGFLTVAGTPVGARIFIDGKDTGKFSPAEFSLDPATHSVALHKDGYFDSTTAIKLAAGQSTSYSPSLRLEGRTDNIKVVGGGFKRLFGGGSSEGMGRIEIKTDPKGAQVIINGSTLPKLTPFEIQLEPGNYEITLQKDGYKPIHKSIITEANQKMKIEEPLSK